MKMNTIVLGASALFFLTSISAGAAEVTNYESVQTKKVETDRPVKVTVRSHKMKSSKSVQSKDASTNQEVTETTKMVPNGTTEDAAKHP